MSAEPPATFLDDVSQKWAFIGLLIGAALMIANGTGKIQDVRPFLNYTSDLLMPLIIGLSSHKIARTWLRRNDPASQDDSGSPEPTGGK